MDNQKEKNQDMAFIKTCLTGIEKLFKTLGAWLNEYNDPVNRERRMQEKIKAAEAKAKLANAEYKLKQIKEKSNKLNELSKPAWAKKPEPIRFNINPQPETTSWKLKEPPKIKW